MYRLVLLPVAKEDIKDAASWYESKKEKLGKRFTLHVRQITAIVKENPYLYAIRYNEVRTAVLDMFPFMIHYIIDEPGKKVVIIAVLHTSRTPDIWTGNRNSGEL
ncbi:type II toxin-antitoxin system RelE/ParE family toxin [Mucilaginibacter rigui]|uniref:Type II toxin-antitoxin system RelE/ParE family toxin n=1 Tax=Mucilaginibacter rigui TaxID=534635 RepID=A0ABR7WZV6_9SPHI|nr:type II toxin-antitoxin system RelE/ParE family toxin [Mucilaginibacter rigui]MBD1383860.1 type II toxin-antitoxin system RelE/ParE family toxin [Mucilaginibacter rigui]